MRKRSELIFSLILVPIDYLALLGAFVLAYVIRVKIDDRPVAHPIGALDFLGIALSALPVWILIFALVGLYALTNQRGRLGELGKIFVAVSGGVMFMILIDFLQRDSIFPSKSIPIYAYGLGLLFVFTARLIVRSVQRHLFSYGIGVHRALIVGSGEIAQRLRLNLAADRGYRLVGCLETARGVGKRMAGIPHFSSFEQALATLGRRGFDEVIQADSALKPEEILDIVTYATNNHISYRFIPNQFGLYAVSSEFGNLAGIPVVELKSTPLDGWGRIVKRAFDVIGAAFGLVILSPVFLAIALVIKATDPGPVFYRHRRLTRTGSELQMFKFRSMAQRFTTDPAFAGKTAEQVFSALGRPELVDEFRQTQKVHDDPRVTTVGHWLRKTSLDELPQLLNALRGDMSLVGPRPVIPVELERYGDHGASFLALKPGITGLWQISGRSDLSYDDRVKLDIFYVEHWSLGLDLKILLKTVITILTRRGAY